jgi:hypothetical protein
MRIADPYGGILTPYKKIASEMDEERMKGYAQ